MKWVWYIHIYLSVLSSIGVCGAMIAVFENSSTFEEIGYAIIAVVCFLLNGYGLNEED